MITFTLCEVFLSPESNDLGSDLCIFIQRVFAGYPVVQRHFSIDLRSILKPRPPV